MLSKLPKVKQNVIVMTQPRIPFMKAEAMVTRGSFREASLISSNVCTTYFAPGTVQTAHHEKKNAI